MFYILRRIRNKKKRGTKEGRERKKEFYGKEERKKNKPFS